MGEMGEEEETRRGEGEEEKEETGENPAEQEPREASVNLVEN